MHALEESYQLRRSAISHQKKSINDVAASDRWPAAGSVMTTKHAGNRPPTMTNCIFAMGRCRSHRRRVDDRRPTTTGRRRRPTDWNTRRRRDQPHLSIWLQPTGPRSERLLTPSTSQSCDYWRAAASALDSSA